jgi:Sulfotransferase family
VRCGAATRKASAAEQDDMRVLYVGGTGRSGSTVLANVLGELPGMVSVGEVRFLWERGVLEDRLCGCGERFSTCPFWTEVVQRSLGALDAAALADLARGVHGELHEATRLRGLPRTALTRTATLPAGSRLPELLPKVYAAIGEVSGADVVVDSSKLPTYARVLADLPGVEVSVAHLVRDPRGAAFSWRRTKEQPDRGGLMEQRGAGKSAALWTAWNYGLERLFPEPGRYARLTYEELLTAPQPQLRALLASLDMERDTAGVFADETTVRLSVNHTVAGNPARHRHGLVPMRLDDEWRTAMPARDRRIVTTMTYPLLRRYGFTRRDG